MTATIGIVAHTARLTQAEQLANQVQADYISVDDGTLGCERNHRKVWACLADSATEWITVLEDDASPCDDFRRQLRQAHTHAPTPIVSLYLGTGHPVQWQRFIRAAVTRAEQSGATWILSDHLLHAVGYTIRAELLPELLAQTKMELPIDEAITQWATQGKHRVAYTLPSLVDHQDGETVIAKRHDGRPRSKPRHAWRHGRPDWNERTVEM